MGVLAAVMVSCSNEFPVVFLIEGSADDSPKMIQKHKGKIFSKAGVVGTADIKSYTTFQDFKTGSFGAAFFLGPGAKNRYYGLTQTNQGKLVLPIAGGKPCEMFRINQPVSDGVICIYSGLTKEDVEAIRENYEPHERETEKQDAAKAKTKKKIKDLQQ